MDKLVYVKTAEAMQGKSAKYLKVTDQDGQAWNIFEQTPVPQIGKCYLFSFEKNGEWNNLTKITPLVNIFQQKALKEVANRNDVWRNYSICFSYVKDLVESGQLEFNLDEMFAIAEKIYDKFQKKADEEIQKLEGDTNGKS